MPLSVLTAYPPHVAAGPWEPVVGGFSGARLWRSPEWRLKAWPKDDVSPEHLRQTHAWMRAASLDLVPKVCPTRGGDTVVIDDRWTWDCVQWIPGEPLLREPTPSRLAAAGRSLATLHVAWQSHSPRVAPCPAILRRLARLQNLPSPEASNANLGDLLRRHLPKALADLRPWLTIDVPLHPCLCDVWTDHVLYEGDRVTGFIDFGAARIDHPMVDLARLLGDSLGGDTFRWQPLLDAYHAVPPLTATDHALLAILERTGPVAAAATWMERLSRRPPTDAERNRIAAIVRRLADR